MLKFFSQPRSPRKTPRHLKKTNFISTSGFICIFYMITTFFILAVLRFAVFLPELFRAKSAKKFDFTKRYSDSTEQQLNLVFSQFGVFSWYMIFIILFLFMGMVLFSIPKKVSEKFRRLWIRVLNITITIGFAICISIFSIWKA